MPSRFHVVFFISGIAGLGYEIVWIRMFSAGLGHEVLGVMAVVSAFLGGLALGAWGLDRRIGRSPRPDLWYAVLEGVIGVWSILCIVLVPEANRGIAALTGLDAGPVRLWFVAFAVPFLVLLPATAAMGATLPAMDRFLSGLVHDGRVIGGVYGANTLGAVVGVVMVTFLMIPAAGLAGTSLVLAAFNAVCAVAVVVGVKPAERGRSAIASTVPGAPGSCRLGVTVLVTGLLGIGYEVLAVRVMAEVLENTVYSFASALAVYLLGTALGAVAYQRLGPGADGRRVLAYLLQATAAACLLGILVLPHAGVIYEGVRATLGGGFAASVAAEMALAGLVFILPSAAMGATFSHLALSARDARGGIGRALGLNVVGGAMAPIVFTVVLLPVLGAKAVLVGVALAYFALIPVARPRVLAGALPAIGLLAFVPADLVLVEPPPGGRLIEYRPGAMASVAVVESPDLGRLLKVNNRFAMGGSLDTFAARRMAHIPLVLHPAPRRALFLGLGTGITCGAAAVHPDLETVCVELLPEVVAVLGHFAEANRGVGAPSGPVVRVADARRYLVASPRKFDVIVADLYHPSRDGSGTLYAREHFQAARDRLAPGGLFAQWLPLYQLDGRVLRTIIRTYLDVFPGAWGFLGAYNVATPVLALVAGREALGYPSDWLERRVADGPLGDELRRHDLGSSLALFGTLLAGPEDLARFAGGGPLNTDDRPVIAFTAPSVTYAKRQSAAANLETLVDAFAPGPRGLIDGPAAFSARLTDYQRARNIYLEAETERVAGRLDKALERYLASVRASHEFGPAYSVTILLARRMAADNPAAARALLGALVRANPTRPEAPRALQRLGGRR